MDHIADHGPVTLTFATPGRGPYTADFSVTTWPSSGIVSLTHPGISRVDAATAGARWEFYLA